MMNNLLFKRVVPIVPRILRSGNRIDCRLCSNERNDPGDNNNMESKPRDQKLSNMYAPSPLTSQEMSSHADGSTPPNISLLSKHISFDERDAPVILDVEEEQMAAQRAFVPRDPLEDVFTRISLLRGQEGVFDLQELVEVLKLSKAKDICVIAVPAEAKYVDYMLIVTGKSQRHMLAMAEFVRKVYKQKRNPEDAIPKIEGKTCKDWMALDLGNMALHIFSPSARGMYDLENLWAVGSAYDPKSQQQESDIVSLLQQHSFVLDNLHPAD